MNTTLTQGIGNKQFIFYTYSKSKPSVQIIPAIDEIIEYENGNPVKKLIRYAPGISSIYTTENIEDLKKRNTFNIVLKDGLLSVSPYEIILLEYLRKCNYNATNENRDPNRPKLFSENIPGKASKSFVTNNKIEVDVKHKIHYMSAFEIESLAYTLGLPNIESKLTDDLRRDLLVFSNTKFQLINDLINDTTALEIKAVIGKAIEKGVIKTTFTSAAWDNGIGILNIEYGKDIKHELYLYLSSSQGKQVYETLNQAVNPYSRNTQQNFVKTEEVIKEVPQISNTVSDEDKSVDLLNKAFTVGVFYNDGKNIMMSDKPKNIKIANSTEELINLLSSDALFFAKVDKKVSK